MGVFCNFVCAAGDLAALAEHPGAVGIRKFDRVVIENVAVLFAGADLAAAHALCFNRMAVFDPVADVKIMNMLFADVIAAEPSEEVPVADLVLELGEAAAIEWLLCRVAAVPVAAKSDEVADFAVVDPLDSFLIRRLMAALKADADF